MKHLLLVIAGGGIGAGLRYVCAEAVHRHLPPTFPWGTLTVNMIGCYLIGLLWELSDATVVNPGTRVFLMTGLLGAFTTFSTFSLETLELLRQGEFKLAFANQVISVGVGLLLVIAGSLTIRLSLRIVGTGG